MGDKKQRTYLITVRQGPYATVRAIEKSGLVNVTRTGIVNETDRTYTYEITGEPK